MNRTLLVAPLALAFALASCDSSGDKKPVSAPLERSQVVAADTAAVAVAPTPLTPVSASSPPKAPRALCAGQMSAPGRAAPKKPLSQNVATGEAALPAELPLGAGYTWVNFWAA